MYIGIFALIHLGYKDVEWDVCRKPIKLWIYIYWGTPIVIYLKNFVVIKFFKDDEGIKGINTTLNKLYSLVQLCWLFYGANIYNSSLNNCGSANMPSDV